MRFLPIGSAPIAGSLDRTDPLGRGLIFWAPLTEDAGTTVWSHATPNVRGAFTGGATWCSGGPNGSAVNLPASGTINFGNPPTFSPIGPLTAAIWINPTNFSNYNGLISKTNGGQPEPVDWYTLITTGVPRFILGSTGGFETATANTAPTLGAWNHIAVSIDNNGGGGTITCIFYLNGRLDRTGPMDASSAPGVNGVQNLLIGNRNDGVTQANAKFADARIYSRALTPGEVALLYTDGLRPWRAKPRPAVPKPAVAAPGYRARVVRWG
jgi:hypothetical protein